jgi:hypothetical protein
MQKPFDLSDEKFHELMRFGRLYRKQEKKCMGAKVHLASCMMIGAALEADLVAICHLYSDEIQTKEIPHFKKDRLKPLSEWTLFQLIKVCDPSYSLGQYFNYPKVLFSAS